MSDERKWKRGDIGPDGRIFWCYNVGPRERWMTRGEFEANKTKESARASRRILSEEAKARAKELSRSEKRRKTKAQKTAEWKKKNPEALQKQCERRLERKRNERQSRRFFVMLAAPEAIRKSLENYTPPMPPETPTQKQANPEFKPDANKWKSGDIGPDGRVFMYYRKNGAYWSSVEAYETRKARSAKKTKEWKIKNPEKAREQARISAASWRLRNPEKWREIQRLRNKKRKRSPEYKKRKNARKTQKQKQKRAQKNEKQHDIDSAKREN